MTAKTNVHIHLDRFTLVNNTPGASLEPQLHLDHLTLISNTPGTLLEHQLANDTLGTSLVPETYNTPVPDQVYDQSRMETTLMQCLHLLKLPDQPHNTTLNTARYTSNITHPVITIYHKMERTPMFYLHQTKLPDQLNYGCHQPHQPEMKTPQRTSSSTQAARSAQLRLPSASSTQSEDTPAYLFINSSCQHSSTTAATSLNNLKSGDTQAFLSINSSSPVPAMGQQFPSQRLRRQPMECFCFALHVQVVVPREVYNSKIIKMQIQSYSPRLVLYRFMFYTYG